MKLYLSSIAMKTAALPMSCLNQCRYALESFFYIEEKYIDYYLSRRSFIMDSGAFTFRESVKSLTYEELEKFTLRYAAFINKYGVQLFFEMDVDSLFGLGRVEQLRELLERETGCKSIPVWHIERGKQYFIDMCREYPYVAIGGIAGGTRKQYAVYQKYFPWFIKTAHDFGAKIHGLGFTPGNLAQYDFDSVDSSTWASGGRFGVLHQYDGEHMRNIHPSKRRAKDYKQIDEHNFLEWCYFQKDLERI